MKTMAFGPITSWQIDGETMETVRDVIFWGSKITAEDDCSHEIKRCLLVWRKTITKLYNFFKSRDITLLKKFSIIKAMIFPVVMYGCDSCTIKNGERRRLMVLNCGVLQDSWVSLGLQGDPYSHPKGNQSWIFIGRTDAEIEPPILWANWCEELTH